MAIKEIARDICETCSLRAAKGCPIVESCATDVIRLDDRGMPYIAYPNDCHCCFLCQIDCPNGAVRVSAEVTLPLIPVEFGAG